VRYSVAGEMAKLAAGVQVSLNVINVFDRNPRMLMTRLRIRITDAANASPIGREISLLFVKQWQPEK